MSRTVRRATVLAAGLALLTATAAAAHPAFDPNQVPGGETIESTLVIPHGCNPDGGMPEEGAANPTTLFELQLSDAVEVFEPGDVEGWDVSRDGDVVTWADAGGATTDPIELPVSFQLVGDAGAEVHLSAYQQCEAGGEFRWIGTPDQEADLPAVALTLTSGAIAQETTADDHAGHGSEMASEMGSEVASDTSSEMAPEVDAMEETAAGDEGGVPTGVLVALGLAAAGGLGYLVRRRTVA